MKKRDAVQYFGSQQAIADILGLKKAAVSTWPDNAMPLARQAQLELLSGGELKATKLPNYKKLGITERDYQKKRTNAA